MKALLQASLFGIGGLAIGLILVGGINWSWKNRTLPEVTIGKLRAGNLSAEQIKSLLDDWETKCRQIELVGKEKEIKLDKLTLDKKTISKQALKAGKGLKIVANWHRSINVEPKLTEESWWQIKQTVGALFEEDGKAAQIYQNKNGWIIKNGQDGWRVDENKLKSKILERLKNNNCSTEIEVPVERKRKKLKEKERLNLVTAAKKLAATSLELIGPKKTVLLKGKELINFLETDPSQGKVGQISQTKIKAYLESLKWQVDKKPRDARFKLKNKRVVEFSPAESGYELEVNDNIQKLIQTLKEEGVGKKQLRLKVKTIPPKITIKDSNNLGIVELLGRGESYYRHSIASRIYNVELAAKKINGVLIAPGEEFSFNQAVGEISRATGFKSAYIIKDGRTILGDGGGVCQVSTTVFRAALKAGLPITERWAHAYRVGYYEQNSKPGFDATVFSPNKDLKFKNDTGSYILLDSWYEEKKRHLVVDLYGKRDGRKSFIKNVRVWGIVPPPPPIYQNDPNLPKGTLKQVDWRAWGAKAKFDYLVEKNGKVWFQKTFRSDYRPWQDVFLVGTKN